MSRGFKNALIFTSGVAVGTAIGIVSLVNYALKDECIREGIKNKISNSVTKAIFGGERPRYVSKVSHANYSGRYEGTWREINKRVNEILFETHEMAEEVLNSMKDICDAYGVTTVADFYDLIELDTVYTDTRYGWVSLRAATIEKTQDGHRIKFPDVVPL